MNTMEKIVKDMAAIYHFDGDITSMTYEEQISSPDFIKILTFNCLVMDAVQHCYNPATDCAGCRAKALFDKCGDAECRRHIAASRLVLAAARKGGAL